MQVVESTHLQDLVTYSIQNPQALTNRLAYSAASLGSNQIWQVMRVDSRLYIISYYNQCLFYCMTVVTIF